MYDFYNERGNDKLITMAIDGASRRNGKPDCLSTGAVFIEWNNMHTVKLIKEYNSTNQRGELHALVTALGTGLAMCRNGRSDTVILITDSEYIFNTVTKEWYVNWDIKGWVTYTGEPVKNQDLWKMAAGFLQSYRNENFELIPYHIKGHLASIGKATAASIASKDSTGKTMLDLASTKVDEAWYKNPEKFQSALALFEMNHNHSVDKAVFSKMAMYNLVADCYAGYYADKVDAEWNR